MSNLLLITDMARISKIFARLSDGDTFTLRTVNNLEKGGEEIAHEKPDVVFVQTHLSGLSADILLNHLKKQLGRKRSRFVLLATPGQVSKDILKLYHGWLDISCKDSELLTAVQTLLTSLLSKNRRTEDQIISEARPDLALVAIKPLSTIATTTQLDPSAVSVTIPVPPPIQCNSQDISSASPEEASLEDRGLTYSPRARLSVYSEFNGSFDSAINRTKEPEPLASSTPEHDQDWDTKLPIETVSPRSKSSTFLLWLAPVLVVVVIVTFLQKYWSDSKPVSVITKPAVSMPSQAEPVSQAVPAKAPLIEPSKPAVPVKPDQDTRMTDKAVISAIAENRGQKKITPPDLSTRPSELPDFIPRKGLDKQYGTANPGWERYKGQATEFKVLREAQSIKAIQIIDLSGQGVPESFMKAVLGKVVKTPAFKAETSEKKEGYEIQRGQVSDNLRVVYYRDVQEGKLRAFVMIWQ